LSSGKKRIFGLLPKPDYDVVSKLKLLCFLRIETWLIFYKSFEEIAGDILEKSGLFDSGLVCL